MKSIPWVCVGERGLPERACAWACVYVCVECVRVLCLCLCTLSYSFVRAVCLWSPVLSYSALSGRVCVWPGQGRAGRVGCWINANKVSGVGCDNAVDGDEAGGKDKVAVVKS